MLQECYQEDEEVCRGKGNGMPTVDDDIKLAELFSKSVVDAGKLYQELSPESKKILVEAFAEALYYMDKQTQL